MANKRIVAFDIETTGLALNDELLQISFIDDKLNVLFSDYVKPVKHTEWPEAMEHNKITPDMVKDSKTLAEIKDDLIKVLDSADILVGFNSNTFDVRRLELWLDYKIKADCVDVKTMAEKEFGMYPKIIVSLDDVCGWFGITNEQAHDSLEDTRATMKIFLRMIEESKKPKLSEIYKFEDGTMIYTRELADKYEDKTGSRVSEIFYLENGKKVDKIQIQDKSKYRVGNFIKGKKTPKYDYDDFKQRCVSYLEQVYSQYDNNIDAAQDELDRVVDNYQDDLAEAGATEEVLTKFEEEVIAEFKENIKDYEQEEVTVKCICKGIYWDVDREDYESDEEYDSFVNNLPKDYTVEIEVNSDASEEEIREQAVDQLSDEIGYCINSVEEIQIENI